MRPSTIASNNIGGMLDASLELLYKCVKDKRHNLPVYEGCRRSKRTFVIYFLFLVTKNSFLAGLRADIYIPFT